MDQCRKFGMTECLFVGYVDITVIRNNGYVPYLGL